MAVVTDLQAGGWEVGTGRLAPHIKVETRRVGSARRQVGRRRGRPGTAAAVRPAVALGSVEGDTRLSIEVDGVMMDDGIHRVGPRRTTVPTRDS